MTPDDYEAISNAIHFAMAISIIIGIIDDIELR